MDTNQVIFGVALIVILLAMAVFFAWRQGKALRGLQGADLSPEDRLYFRNQAWRRLACSALMVLLAVLLASSFFFEEPAGALVREGAANRERGEMRALNQEERSFMAILLIYWISMPLVLLSMIMLAAVDFFAIRRYGKRHYRQIQDERRAMIAAELARIRSEKNGHE